MTIQFAMVFLTEADAQAAAMTLRAARYEVDLRAEGDGTCVVSAVRDVAGSAIPETRVWMQGLADKHGGDFLGHGGISIHGVRG